MSDTGAIRYYFHGYDQDNHPVLEIGIDNGNMMVVFRVPDDVLEEHVDAVRRWRISQSNRSMTGAIIPCGIL